MADVPRIEDKDFAAALAEGKKPIVHKIHFTEKVDGLNLSKLHRFYLESLYFNGESPRFQFRSQFSIEPRFALGRSDLIQELAKLARAKIARYGIKQIVAPGYGGVCGLNVFVATGLPLQVATLRIEGKKTKRLLTAIEGYLDKKVPVWLTDDLLASGNASLKALRLLREQGYTPAGFIPLVADITGNTGTRAFQNITRMLPFKFDYLMGCVRRAGAVPAMPYRRSNATLFAVDAENKVA
jgi:orotate phosphoribosyltransferase